MAFNPWCIATTHPIAVQVADKYGLFRHEARTIINNARAEDPALQATDDFTLEFLESRDAFKTELDKYIKKAVDDSEGIFQRVKGERTDAADYVDELEEELATRKFSEDEVEELINRYQSMAEATGNAKKSMNNIIEIIDAFKDTRRLEFVGNWICRYISSIVTELETDASLRDDLDINTHRNRIDYFTDENAIKAILGAVKDELDTNATLCEEEGKEQLAKELNAAVKQFDTILYLYGATLFRNEGIKAKMLKGLTKGETESDSDSDQRNDSDPHTEQGEDEGNLDGEKPSSLSFSASDQNKSVSSKIVPDIKILLYGLKETDSEGNPIEDKYGYGLNAFVSVPLATNSILSIVNGCETFEEMRRALERNISSTPWVKQLLEMLDESIKTKTDEFGNIVELPSKSRKEQLQSMFFRSFHKQHTMFRTTYMGHLTSEEGGFATFNNSTANVKKVEEKLMNGVKTKFSKMSGAKIFKELQIDFNEINTIRSDIASARTMIGAANRRAFELAEEGSRTKNQASFAGAYSELKKAEKSVKTILEKFGFSVTDKMLDTYMSNTSDNVEPLRMYGPYAAYGDEKFALRQIRLNDLVDYIGMLSNAFTKWKQAIDSGETTDTAITNPFMLKKGLRSNYRNISHIRNWYNNVASLLSEFSQDTFESMAYINHKPYYSWNNHSTVQTIVENLSRKDKDRVQNYIKKKYGKDSTWFLKPGSTENAPHFYSDWLEDIFHGTGRSIFQYSEKPSFCETEYEALPDVSYFLSIITDYFSDREKKTAWYRMLISSDKPRFSTIQFRRLADKTINPDGSPSEKNYKSVIARKAGDFFAQEIRRAESVVRYARKRGTKIENYDIEINEDNKHVFEKIKNKQEVTASDVVKDGKYIFRNTGAAFFLNKFINEAIEIAAKPVKKTDQEVTKAIIGDYVVDRIFNSWKGKREAVTDGILGTFKDAFQIYMDEIKESTFNKLYKVGVLDTTKNRDDGTIHLTHIAGPLRQWHSDEESYLSELYFMNDNEIQEFIKTHPDFVKDEGINPEVPEDQKTWLAEIVGFREDLDEFVYNNWLAKANMSEIFDVDLAFYGNSTNFQKRNAQVISAGYTTDPNARIHKERVSDGYNRSITLKTTKIPSTQISEIEGVLNIALEGIDDQRQRKQIIKAITNTVKELGKIDATDGQAWTVLTALRKRMAGQGEWSRSDREEDDEAGMINGKHIFTDEAVYRRIKRHWSKEGDMDAKYTDIMHVFAQPKKPFVFSFTNMQRDGRGTITVPIQHKNSEYALIYLSSFLQDPELHSQMEAIAKFLEETAEKDPIRGIDTVNFDSAVKIGNNSNAIDISGLSPQETLEKLRTAVYGSNDAERIPANYRQGVVTEYEETDYKIQQEKPEHFKDNAQPLGSQVKILSINNIKDDEVCTLPNGKQITGKELKRRYFDALKRKAGRSEKDFKRDFGIDYPLSKRLHRLSNTLKELLSSDQKFTVETRRALSITERDGIDQFVLPLDEPGLQGAVESMLYSKTRKTYYKQKTNGGVVVQATSWGASKDLKIIFDEEGNFKYFEAEIPMPNYVRDMIADKKGNIDKKYFNEDGTWNMDEIKKAVPDSVFDAICYRIPTEAKYSMMLCRIVRFSPESAGSVAQYPIELTTFTGADFDIDTDYVELRPIPGSKSENVDSEIFDLQVAALRSKSAALETFKPGDFSDLSELSYYITLLGKGYTEERLQGKNLKKLCMEAEDLDLMSPEADILLHNQNSDAGDMIGMAAVGVTSHAFYSLYNDIIDGDDNRNPLLNKDNFLRINFNSSGKNVQSFRVTNDKDKNDITELDIKDDALLDMMYDMDGKLISTEISKYVGASADAAKDAALYRLNITKRTMPILILMHRLGISSDVARLFVSQPAIRDIVSQFNSTSPFGYSTTDSILENTRYKWSVDHGVDMDYMEKEWNTVKTETTHELKYSELLDTIMHPKDQTLHDKLKLMHIFETLSDASDMIRNLDGFVRYNSSKAMAGTSFLDRQTTRRGIDKLEKNLNAEKPRIKLPQDVEISPEYDNSEFGRLCSMFPYIANTILGERSMADKVILENMKTYNATFFKAVDRMGINDDAEAKKALYAGWKNYLLFVGPNRIADFHDERVARHYTTEFARMFFDKIDEIKANRKDIYEDVIENNSFIDSLYAQQSKEGFVNFYMLATNISGRNEDTVEQFKRDWESLLKYPETSGLATDAAIHFLARSAAFSRNTPVTDMPLKIKEAIPGYTEAFQQADRVIMSDEDFDYFLTIFALNNTDNKKIVPHIYNSKRRTVVRLVEDKIVRPDENGKDKEYPCLKAVFNEESIDRLRKWIYTDDAGVSHLKVPVIVIDDVLYTAPDNVITLEEAGKEKQLSFKIVPDFPLGIPNQISEYTGLPGNNLFIINEDAGDIGYYVTEDTEIGQPFIESYPFEKEPSIERDVVQGIRSGIETVSTPYGLDDIPIDFNRYLAKDREDRTQKSFLESRTHLRRAEKLANAFGFSLSFSQRGTEESSPAYILGLAAKEYEPNQHQNAREYAALLSALGFRQSNATVKTYVPKEDCNAYELSIPIESGVKLKNILEKADELGFDYIYNDGSKQLEFVVDKPDSGNKEADRKQTVKLIRFVTEFFYDLKQSGATKANAVELNYIKYDRINKYNNEEILKTLKSDAKYEESEQAVKRPNRKDSEVNGRNRGWKEIRISDLADIALRRQEGEKVDQEIRDIFGEKKRPLKNTNASYEAGMVADKAIKLISEDADIMSELESALDEDSGDLPREIKVNNAIINVANWILGNRPEEGMVEIMGKSGIPEDAATSIINAVNNVLDELDIC